MSTTKEIWHQYVIHRPVVHIPLDKIDVPPEYEREDSLVEDDALLKSVQKEGVQQAIIVKPEGDRYTLIKGTRRLAASVMCKYKDIPALIMPADSDRNHLRFTLTQLRQDLLPSQRYNLIKQVMEKHGLSQKEVGDALGFNEGTISNWLALDRYAPEIVKEIDTGTLSPFHARTFDGLKPEAQVKILKTHRKSLGSMSGHQFHRLIRSEYNPRTHSDLYVNPKQTIEKLERKKKGRKASKRKPLTRDEKKTLVKDLETRETELADSTEELKEKKRQCIAAAQIIHAILRHKEIVAKLPESVREEFEVFCDSY